MIDPDKRIITITNSARDEFDSCRYKTYLSHFYKGVGIAPVMPSAPFRWGSCMHLALEQHYAGMPCDMAVGHALRYYSDLLAQPDVFISEDAAVKIEKEMAMIEGFMPAYVEIYSDDAEKFEIVGQELVLSRHIGSIKDNDGDIWTIMYSGKIDMLLRRHSDQQLVVLDHKSVSMFQESHHDKLQFDYQTTGYCWLAEQLSDEPVRNVIYNCIRKSALRGKGGESRRQLASRIRDDYLERPETYFKRLTPVRTAEQKNELIAAVNLVANDLLRTYKTDAWRKNMAPCSIYSGCQFLSICGSGVVDDTVNFRLKVESHEELANADSEEW
jgi:hypothetical protein